MSSYLIRENGREILFLPRTASYSVSLLLLVGSFFVGKASNYSPSLIPVEPMDKGLRSLCQSPVFLIVTGVRTFNHWVMIDQMVIVEDGETMVCSLLARQWGMVSTFNKQTGWVPLL